MTKQPHLEGFRGRDRQWYLRLRAANGRVLMTSEGYRRRAGVLGVVRLLAPGIEFRWV